MVLKQSAIAGGDGGPVEFAALTAALIEEQFHESMVVPDDARCYYKQLRKLERN